MITLYIPNPDGKSKAIAVAQTGTDATLDLVLEHAYNVQVLNAALTTRIKELENAFGCENCRGNPLTRIDPRIAKLAFDAVMQDTPEWMKSHKAFKEQHADVLSKAD